MNTVNQCQLLPRVATTLSLLAVLSACDGDGVSNPLSDSVTITQGTISDTGSVTVNGRQFSAANATVILDDQPATKDALRSGMQVTVHSQNRSATFIHYDEDVKGPVDSHLPDGTLSVMGQIVVVSSNTVVDDTSAGQITAGDVVEVSGIRDASDTIHASFLEVKGDAPNSYEVRGPVSALDTAAQTFVIGELQIDYSTAVFDNFNVSSLSNTDLLEVKDERRQYEPGSLMLTATKIERYSGTPGQSNQPSSSGSSPTRAEFEIEAYVTAVTAQDSFRIGELVVRIMSNTRFRNGTANQLQINSRIEVEGQLNENGELEAWEIEFDNSGNYHDFAEDESSSSNSDSNDPNDDDDEVELEGVVSSIDPVNGSFAINGILIRTNAGTQFEDGQDRRVSRSEFFSMLTNGSTVVKVEWRNFTGYDDAAHEVEIEI